MLVTNCVVFTNMRHKDDKSKNNSPLLLTDEPLAAWHGPSMTATPSFTPADYDQWVRKLPAKSVFFFPVIVSNCAEIAPNAACGQHAQVAVPVQSGQKPSNWIQRLVLSALTKSQVQKSQSLRNFWLLFFPKPTPQHRMALAKSCSRNWRLQTNSDVGKAIDCHLKHVANWNQRKAPKERKQNLHRSKVSNQPSDFMANKPAMRHVWSFNFSHRPS